MEEKIGSDFVQRKTVFFLKPRKEKQCDISWPGIGMLWLLKITSYQTEPTYIILYLAKLGTLSVPTLLFANTDVSTTKMCLHTSILAKSIMGRREY
jgi:hypothetical protein